MINCDCRVKEADLCADCIYSYVAEISLGEQISMLESATLHARAVFVWAKFCSHGSYVSAR